MHAANETCAKLEQQLGTLRGHLRTEETRATQLLRELNVRQQLDSLGTQGAQGAQMFRGVAGVAATRYTGANAPANAATLANTRTTQGVLAASTTGRIMEQMQAEGERKRAENARLQDEVNALVGRVVELQQQVIFMSSEIL